MNIFIDRILSCFRKYNIVNKINSSNSVRNYDKYSALDALRGLCIVSVFLFHSEVTGFKKGFYGVDVFFIISGYVSYSIFIKSSNRIQYLIRRISRILPLHLLCILIVIFIANISGNTFQKLAYENIYSSFLFIQNISLQKKTSDYFSSANDLNPLLHMWSLSAEVQVLLLSSIFFLTLKIKDISLFLAGFIVMGAIIKNDTYFKFPDFSLDFYSPFFRFIEFYIGVLFFICVPLIYKIKSQMFNFLAIGPFLSGINIKSIKEKFSLINKLLAILFLIIKYGLTTFLKRPLIFFGRYSYGIYLFHQPLLALLRNIGFYYHNIFFISFLFATVLLFSIFVTKYIEIPMRKIVGSYIIIVYILSCLFFPNFTAIDQPIYMKFDYVKFPGFRLDNQSCESADPLTPCIFPSPSPLGTVVLIGDSHARVLSQSLKDKVISRGYNYVDMATGGCPFLLGLSAFADGKTNICDKEFQLKRLQFIHSLNGNVIIIIHQRLEYYINPRGFNNFNGGREYQSNYVIGKYNDESSLERVYNIIISFNDTIKALNKYRILLVDTAPPNGWSPPDRAFFLSKILGGDHPDKRYFNIDKSRIDAYKSLSRELYRNNKSNFEKIISVDYLFCDKFICNSLNEDGRLLYSDSDHLGRLGTQMVSLVIDKELQRLK